MMMKINQTANRKSLNQYFLLITILFLAGISFLPFGLWNVAPVVYAVLGPFLLFIFSYLAKTDLDKHILENHPDLAAKYAIHYGVMKGKTMNAFDLYHNQKELLERNDDTLNYLMAANFQRIKLSIYSFLILGLFTALGIILR